VDFTIEVERSLAVLDGAGLPAWMRMLAWNRRPKSVWRQADRYKSFFHGSFFVNKMEQKSALISLTASR